MTADGSDPVNPQAHEEALGVLIVDDNADLASALQVLVGSWGYRTRVVHTARDAVQQCLEFRPRVVLLDLSLPDEHGYRLAMRVREQMRERAVAFVAITGWSNIADQLQSTAAGISHHLVKPVNHAALRAILDGYQAADNRSLAGR